MTSLSYTTGNPANLTGGANASMNDIQGPFTDIRTFLTSGANTLDYGNIAAVVDSYYKTILQTINWAAGGLAPGTFLLGSNPGAGASIVAPASAAGGAVIRYLDSARWPTGSRAAKLNVAVSLGSNATAAGTNLVFGLYPVTAVAGGAGVVTLTIGAVVAGSTCTFNAPSASALAHVESGDFAFPATGYYALGVSINPGNTAANNALTWDVSLDFRAT